MSTKEEEDKAVEMWKMKKLIKSLEEARGNGTSMISLILPPKSQVSQAQKMLGDEYGTASNIKSRVNRQSVLDAITSTQQRLKLFTRIPDNGLALYCGTILTEEGKEKKVTIDIEPMKPINHSLYMCDNKFHVDALRSLLEDDTKFGFIVMDGNGTLFGTLAGNTRDIIQKITVELPKKHGRGGQSSARFGRLRMEARHNYVHKVAELCVKCFIKNDVVQVSGLVLAGSAEFKNVLSQSDLLDQRLKAKILTIVDVSYGGEQGFNEAIELAGETLKNVKFVQEKKLIQKYFAEISTDSGKFCFGVKDTFTALDAGAVEYLIIFEGLTTNHYTLRNTQSGETITKILTPTEAEDQSHFTDPESGAAYETVDKLPLVEWLAQNYKDYGCSLEFVTDRSQEGSQFVKGFGGIGGILRYKLDFEQFEYDSDEYYSD